MSKPDNRSNNEQRIKNAVNCTKQNMETAEEMMTSTGSEQTKKDLHAKNERRKQAISGMEHEMHQESQHNK